MAQLPVFAAAIAVVDGSVVAADLVSAVAVVVAAAASSNTLPFVVASAYS